ncbi:uncharacterized protein PFL1_03856 [Pseudozyma flocculosa PF-1]|uniref:Uncharacterized protein n=1 Tax=Pseudozyma flocculosa PF-1 TaxID=1277687 RepID=A0A061H6Q7_9BASI|nr:uncharacterized protein PFL1_03856 [Pseudozyma flocculosa PF-1]EPQ28552.1 hypothetical protein PFL1_03856 [Pseudozyma flocculosa PF-1]
MLANRPAEAESVSQAHSVSPKTQRWGSIKQRLSNSMHPSDGVDDEMWDKNDAAFLQEVARDSPLIASDAFDTLMPLEAGYARPASMSSPRLSVDHLYRSPTGRPSSSNTSTSTSSASTASSGHDDFLSSKSWIKNVKRRGSAAAAGGMLPDLPEQPRPDSACGFDDLRSPAGTLDHLSSPIHVASSNRSSFRSSPASSQGDGVDSGPARPLVADMYPRSPSLQGSPSPSMPAIAFRPCWDDRQHDGKARIDLARSPPAHLVEVRMASAAPAAITLAEQHAAVAPASLMEAVEDDHLASSPRFQSSGTLRRGAVSPELSNRPFAPSTTGRRRSIASLLASPQHRDARWADADDLGRPLGEAHHDAFAGPSVRRHQRSGSSLVAGLKKLMGRRERERDPRPGSSSGSPMTTSTAGEGFRAPSFGTVGRRVAEDVHVVGRMPSVDDAQVRGLNLVGVPLSISTPAGLSETSPQKTIRATRRSPSVDILRSFAGFGPAHVASDAPAPRFPSTSAPDDVAASAARSRTKSSDGLGRPFRESISQRIRTQSSVGQSLSRAQARSSVIEHISFDEAQKTTGSSGPIILRSKESLEELRSQHDGQDADHEYVAPVLSPTRPRRPSSPQSSRFSVDTCSTTGAGAGASVNGGAGFDAALRPAPACFGFHSQVYKAPVREYASGRATPSSPSLLSFGSQLTDTTTGGSGSEAHGRAANGAADAHRLVHGSRRSLSSLGSRPWSNLLGSPILSGSSSSFSHHKRLSTASISRPLSVASSAFSDPNDIAADMQDLTLVPRNRFDSNASEPMLHQMYTAPPRPGQQAVRSRRIGPDSRRPMTSGSMTPSSTASTPRFESPLQRSSSVKTFHKAKAVGGSSGNSTSAGDSKDSSDHGHGPTMSAHDGLRDLRTMSTASFARRKRPSFGLAIEPAASSAFDSIPSPLLRTRRPSVPEVDADIPISPRPRAYGDDGEAELEFLQDRPAPSIHAAVVSTIGVVGAGASFGRTAPSADAPNFERYYIHSVDEDGPTRSDGGRLSQATKDLAFGSIAGMCSKVFEHPFDLVKVRLQTQASDRPPRYSGAFDCFRQTYRGEGFRGLYRGLSMPVFGATLENACLFFTYNRIQSVIRSVTGQQGASGSSIQADADSPLSFPQLAIAAAGAGAATSLVLTPIELIKCKMQTGTLLRETGGGVAWFLAFESCSRWFIQRKKALRGRDDVSKRDLGTLELVSAGALAGISYNVVLFPADSVKSTMQTELEMRAPLKPGEAARPKTGFFQTFRNIYSARGIKGLYAGCGVTCLRSAPSSALIFLMVNKLEQAADHYGL